MEAGGCEQLVLSPVVKSKARVHPRLWQDSQKKARRGCLVLGSDFMSIASQFFNTFPVEEQREEQAEAQPPSLSKRTRRDIPSSA